MSTQAAARQRTLAAVNAPLWRWIQNISSHDLFLKSLNGVQFHITERTSEPNSPTTEFVGHTETTPQIAFRGEYDSSQLTISFSLTHEVMLYTFFGVLSPIDGATMGGIILGSLLSQVPEGSEDEGSWSAQAPPREDDDRCPPRKSAATKKRA